MAVSAAALGALIAIVLGLIMGLSIAGMVGADRGGPSKRGCVGGDGVPG